MVTNYSARRWRGSRISRLKEQLMIVAQSGHETFFQMFEVSCCHRKRNRVKKLHTEFYEDEVEAAAAAAAAATAAALFVDEES